MPKLVEREAAAEKKTELGGKLRREKLHGRRS
jgi:hypothetical protein